MVVLLCPALSGIALAGINRWTATGLATGEVTSLAIDPANPAIVYAGVWGQGVFKSTDFGANWHFASSALPGLLLVYVVVDPVAPATVYAGVSGSGVFKSSDGGATWRAVNNGISDLWVHAITVASSGTLYAGTFFPGYGGPGYIFKSINGGESWAQVGLFNYGVLTLAVDPSEPALVYAGFSDTLRTRGGGLFQSFNGGQNWYQIGFPDSIVSSVAVDPHASNIVYAITNEHGLSKSVNRGTTWVEIDSGLVGLPTSIVIDPTNPARLYVGTSAGVFRSTDGGGHWDAMNEGLSNTAVKTLALDASTPTRLYAGTFGGGVFDYVSLPPCTSSFEALCLNGGRFSATTRWTTRDGSSGSGRTIALTSDTGAFWFFSPSNVEVVVKILNGCTFNSRYWAFAAGLTDVNVILTVTDTQTGAVKNYVNPQGTPFQPIQDTSAFASCP